MFIRRSLRRSRVFSTTFEGSSDSHYYQHQPHNHNNSISHHNHHNNLQSSSTTCRLPPRISTHQTPLCLSPHRIILVRHGESKANVDDTYYTHMPDWAIPLTETGRLQAAHAGHRIKQLVKDQPVVLHYSPYRRAAETAECVVGQLSHDQILVDAEDTRLREQDVGNFQDPAEMKKAWRERDRYGRFFYRFPHGESGADVCDRVSAFIESVSRDYRLFSTSEVSNLVVCSHGLTIRLFLLRWLQVPFTTLEMLRNPGNASLVVLERTSVRTACGNAAHYVLTPESVKEVDMPADILQRREGAHLRQYRRHMSRLIPDTKE
eukprot:PhM_4_TR4937/c0_g1_i1/m.79808